VMELNRPQDTYLENELWILTFGGAFQRASVYCDGVPDHAKVQFREALKEKVRHLVGERYCGGRVASEDHIRTIEEISAWASEEYGELLADNRLRIGVAQKLLNLYLKYLWCWGKIPEPPHCPFDRTIIDKLSFPKEITWTTMDSVRDYRTLVEAAKRAAGDHLSLAEWELREFRRE